LSGFAHALGSGYIVLGEFRDFRHGASANSVVLDAIDVSDPPRIR
jgi:hypothetical protein